MKRIDFDRAFPRTPEEIGAAIGLGILKGRRREARRRALARVAVAAATLLVILGAAAFGASRLGGSQPERRPPVVPLSAPSSSADPVPTQAAVSATIAPVDALPTESEVSATHEPADDGATGMVTVGIQMIETPIPSPLPTASAEIIWSVSEITATVAPTPEAIWSVSGARASGEAVAETATATPRVIDTRAVMISTEAGLVEFVAPQATLAVVMDEPIEVAIAESDSETAVVYSERAVYVSDSDDYFHIEYCSACGEGGTYESVTVREALTQGKKFCPECKALEQGEDAVYVSDSDDYFHIEFCSACGEEEAYESVTVGEALARGKALCSECEAHEWAEDMVYVSEGDDYFHTEYCPDWDGEEYDRVTVREALVSGRAPCPECDAGNTVYVSDSEYSYHIGPCSSMEELERFGAKYERVTLREALERGKLLCSTCADSRNDAQAMLELGLGETDLAIVPGGDTAFFHTGMCPAIIEANRAGTSCAAMPIGDALDWGLMLCPECRSMLGPDGVSSRARGFFYTPNGQWYHVESNCSGMENATLHTLDEAVASGKPHCPVCIGENTAVYWLDAPEADEDPVYCANYSAFDGPDYFHIDPECFGMLSARVETMAEARKSGLAPCPACLPGLAGEVAEVDCYTTPGSNYYHTAPVCSGLKNEYAQQMSELAAQAAGKLRCPVCGMKSEAVPEGWISYRPELGGSIADAFPGFTFEREDVYGDRTAWFISDGTQVTRAVSFIQNADGSSALTLDCSGSRIGGLCFPSDFIERLPEPLSVIQDAVGLTDVRALSLDCGADGALTGFTVRAGYGADYSYTWAVGEDGDAALIDARGGNSTAMQSAG